MPPSATLSTTVPRPGRRDGARSALIALVVFIVAYQLRPILFRVPAFAAFYAAHPWQLGETVWKAGWIVVCAAGAMVARRAGPAAAFRELGVAVAPRRMAWALVAAFAAALPMAAAFAVAFPLARGSDAWTIWMTAIVSPVAEEVLFRGWLFRQLYQRARWPFWLAALANAAPFAYGHLAQAQGGGVLALAGVIAVTGLGAAFFAWVSLRAGWNLWYAIGLHALMNLWWALFAVSDTAVGGWTANLARLATIAAAIAIVTVRRGPLHRLGERIRTPVAEGAA